MKTCPRCKAQKSVEDFHRHKGRPDGQSVYCKPCGNAVTAAWKRANLDRARESARRTNDRRRDAIRAWERDHTTPCVDCGQLTSAGYLKTRRKTTRCQQCAIDVRRGLGRSRTERFIKLRRAGLNNNQIAVRESVSVAAVATAFHRADRYGLEVPPSPYWLRGIAA